MSEAANPIDPERFALALESLPLDSLHSKAAELRNSIAHLKSSNQQMLPYAEAGDQEIKEAMFENLSVIGRMNERISLLRAEVEKRGMPWDHGSGVADDGGKMVNGSANGLVDGDRVVHGEEVRPNGMTAAPAQAARQQSGRLTDEELRRRLAEQVGEDEEDGVHL